MHSNYSSHRSSASPAAHPSGGMLAMIRCTPLLIPLLLMMTLVVNLSSPVALAEADDLSRIHDLMQAMTMGPAAADHHDDDVSGESKQCFPSLSSDR